MKTQSFEHIKNRMVKKAAAVWGVSANEIETSFDPVITMLISACASEILKIESTLTESHNRITERLIELMTPETVVGAKPAHAVLLVDIVDAQTTVKPEYLFYYKKMLSEKNASQKLKNIFFSAIQDFKLINANVKFIASGGTITEFLEKKEKKVIFNGKAKTTLPASTLYIGIESKLDALPLNGLSFYFELDDIDNKELFYHYLKHSEWYINDKKVDIQHGFSNSENFDKDNLKTIFEPSSNKTHNIKSQVLNYYKEHYVTIKSGKKKTKTSNYGELTDFAELNAIKLPKNITWIKVVFPSVVENSTLSKVFCALNAFPVLNRELNSFSYQIRDFINILPIQTEDFFLDINSIENTNGNVYLPKQKDVLNTGKGTYSVRGNSAGKLDHRSAKQYLTHLIELLKDESASFSFLNNDFLHSNIKNLNQLIAQLENKISNSPTNFNEVNFITLEPFNAKENLLISYWTTNGSEGNNIKSGSNIDVYKAIGIKQKGNYLVTTSFDGKNNLNMEERLNSYRRSLLSRDRIVTKEDVKALCYETYNDKIEKVDIKRGYTNNIHLSKGIIQCIEIILYPNKKVKYEAHEWDSLNSNLLLFLEKKSTNIFPYKIKIVN